MKRAKRSLTPKRSTRDALRRDVYEVSTPGFTTLSGEDLTPTSSARGPVRDERSRTRDIEFDVPQYLRTGRRESIDAKPRATEGGLLLRSQARSRKIV